MQHSSGGQDLSPPQGLSPYYGARMYGQGGEGYGGYRRGYYYPGGSGAGGGSFGFGAFSVRRMLRSKWLMLTTFVLIAGSVTPWIWVLQRPKYSSTAVMRVSPIVSYLVFRTENNGFLPLYNSYVNTQMAIMRSPKILERVLDRQQVKDTAWYQNEGRDLFGERRNALSRLILATSVRARGGTELIDVTVTTENPEDAKLLADAIVDEHRTYVEEMLRENEGWMLETLTKEHADLLHQVEGLTAIRYNLAKRLGVMDATALQAQLRSYLSVLESEQRRLQRTIDLSRWEVEKLASATSQPASVTGQGDGVVMPSAPTGMPLHFAEDGEHKQLAANLESIKNQIEVDLLSYGPEHPRIMRLDGMKRIAERLLEERESELEREWQASGGESGTSKSNDIAKRRLMLEEYAQKTEQELGLIEDEINLQRAQLADITDISLELSRYEEEIANKRVLSEAVRKRVESLGFEGRHAPARVQVASPGLRPSSPSEDRRRQLTLMTGVVALLISLALGYVRTSLDKRIYDAGEIQQVYRAPFLGVLPSLASVKVPRELGGTQPLSTGSSSYYGYGAAESCQTLMESVRMVRTALLERVNEENQRAVLITSSVPRTGKSSVAVLLARSLAMLNKRILLIEADLRHPTLAGRLSMSPKHGLAAILTGAARDDEAIIKSEVPNLDILIAGEIPEDFTTEMLANGVFASCVERWKQDYDFVLLDSPPLLPVADARILASYADGTIMVLRSSHDMRNEAMEAYAQLSAAGGRLLGTVFIGGRSHGSRPYSYGYGYLQSPVTWQWRQRYGYYGYGPKAPRLGESSASSPQDTGPSDSQSSDRA
ncbi:MAG: polysaccharide biosynthesis tyrosine autokinase [Phycisphaerae bacterium]|nr:polysaccharide biosynthesis tyrosine autokinase [Phycisphaerae bacterium]